jgi:hypothetical protein
VLRGQHLQLQGHREAVLGAPRPEPEEALTGFEHGARRHGLETVEVGQAVGIGLVGPGEPEALDLVLERAVLNQRGGLDPAADRRRGDARRGVRGVRVGTHQLTGPCPLQLAAPEAALHLGALEACAQGELARCQEPRRPGDARDQVQGSETLRSVDPDLTQRRLALERLELALQFGDRPGDLGGAAVLDRAAVVGDARDGAAPSAFRGAPPALEWWPCQFSVVVDSEIEHVGQDSKQVSRQTACTMLGGDP